MRTKTSKIELNKVYMFDHMNTLNKRIDECINLVKVVRIHKKLFHNIYECIDLDSGNGVLCRKEYLTDILTKEDFDNRNNILIRLPDDLPYVNDNDIVALENVLDILSENSDVYIRVQMLISKLKYFSNLNNV